MKNFIAGNVLNRLKILFAPLALAFVFYFAWQSRGLLSDLFIGADYLFLLLSVLCWIATHFISPVFTVFLMKKFPNSLTYKEAFMIHAGRLPAKYLPGGVWHTVARAVDYKNKDISPADIGYYLLLEQLVAASVTLFIGGTIVAASVPVSDHWIIFVAGMAIMAGVLLIMLPKLLAITGFRKKQAISYKSYLHGVVLSVIFWLFAATSFVLFIKAFDNITGGYSIVGVGGIYIFSWGMGFLAIFAPQGIGVMEFVAGTLLRPGIPLSGFIALLASFRINIFLADMAAWGISYRVRHRL